jgi:hypothetical protein
MYDPRQFWSEWQWTSLTGNPVTSPLRTVRAGRCAAFSSFIQGSLMPRRSGKKAMITGAGQWRGDFKGLRQ